jgi:hypothetical protein
VVIAAALIVLAASLKLFDENQRTGLGLTG